MGFSTITEALESAGLAYDVATEPVFAMAGTERNSAGIDSALYHRLKRFAQVVVRTDKEKSDPSRYMGVVGSGYTPVSNVDSLAPLGDAMVEQGLTIDGAWSPNGGAKVYVSGTLPLETNPTGEVGEAIGHGALLSTAHDGTGAVRSQLYTKRLVCTNGMTTKEYRAATSSKHTSNVHIAIKRAASAMDKAMDAAHDVTEFLGNLAQVEIDSAFVSAYLKVLFPDAPKKNGGVINRRAEIEYLFNGGQIGAGTRAMDGTAYGLFSATAEYIDHKRGTRDTGNSTLSETSRRRQASIDGSGAVLRERAAMIIESAALGTDGRERLIETARSAVADKLIGDTTGASNGGAVVDDMLAGIDLN